jgi:prephenate dehydratase
MAEDSKIEKARSSEANVLIEFRMVDAMSEEVLDANSDDVLEAVEAGAADIALGAAIALNTHTCSIKLRFDVLAENDAEVHQKIAEVIAVILRDTDFELHVNRSSVEAQQDVEETPALAAA